MSNGSPPITEAPVPPSIAGIPQPVFGSGSPTAPAAGPITGTPIIPPPTIGDPVGFPVFPPVGPNTAPVPVPVGPLVGPAVGPAPVPPSLPGVQQPQFVPPGSATVPASLFPDFTTTPPSPPIVFANIFKIGTVPPPLPSTPGQNPPPIVISSVPTIPQLPWNPNPIEPPPVNTVPPLISPLTNLEVGSQLVISNGTWTSTNPPLAYSREWTRNGSPIGGATANVYTLVTADVGTQIGCDVTATDAKGGASSMSAAPVGPITPVTPPTNTAAPVVSGSTIVGGVLSRTTGTWTGSPTFATIWQRGGTNIAGATAATYTLVTADADAMIGVNVTGTNAGGSNIAVSNTVGPITQPLSAPVNTVAPTVSVTGQPSVGSVVQRTTGTWTGNPAPTFTQQWQGGANTASFGDLSGATGATYGLLSRDMGNLIRVRVIGTNSQGNSSANSSNHVGPVVAALGADEEEGEPSEESEPVQTPARRVTRHASKPTRKR